MPRGPRRNLGLREKEALLKMGYEAIRDGKLPDRAALLKSIDKNARHLAERYIDGAYMSDLHAFILLRTRSLPLEAARLNAWTAVADAMADADNPQEETPWRTATPIHA